MTQELFAGMDLHSNNVVIGLVDQSGKRIKHQKVECDINKIDGFLEPYKPLIKRMAVESTFNWYWLVDGLRARSYPIELANAAAMQQYNGIKYTDDKHDAFFIADLLRMNSLPTGNIYDPVLRPVRDMLRRRLMLVHHRTAYILSLQSLYMRTTGQELSLSQLKKMEESEFKALYEHPANALISTIQFRHLGSLDADIAIIEKGVLGSAQELPCYEKLNTIPGIGRILAMTITMEVGDIKRFPSAGDYASYCRAVDARRNSNEKKKANNNAKCGNKYLGWAYIEAANFATRYNPECRAWFDRKKARTNRVIATKALACKIAKASWYIMSRLCDYDGALIFPEQAKKAA